MKFSPENYSIPDIPQQSFIDKNEIWNIINSTETSFEKVEKVITKALSKNRLNMQEVAVLINANDEDSINIIKKGAKTLKEQVYGNRIVLFAPLYIGNKCQNNCSYCGFRVTNTEAERKTLTDEELVNEVLALEENGQGGWDWHLSDFSGNIPSRCL